MAPNKPGTVKLDVFVKSDSYIGLDQQKAVEFEVVSAATLPQYEPHPDDLELDNEPTLFEQVMQAYDDETDSEDEVSALAHGMCVLEVSVFVYKLTDNHCNLFSSTAGASSNVGGRF